MELKVAQVILDARDSNGWHVIGEISDRHEPNRGTHPSGVIAFVDTHKAASGRGPGGSAGRHASTSTRMATPCSGPACMTCIGSRQSRTS